MTTERQTPPYVANYLAKKEGMVAGHRACVGCGEVLAVKMVCKALGERTIIANATGCMEIVSSQMPYSSWTVPWIHTLFENTAAVASGIEAGLKAMTRKGRPDLADVKVVAMAGDGGTSDIGLQALSGAMERGHNMIYVCFDNEAYMNTGIQRSSSTPYGATTTTSPAGKAGVGQMTWKKNMPAIMAAHDIPYVATASPTYFRDLIMKVEKARAVKGPSYLHIFSVCPTGWRSAPDISVKIARSAVQTGVFPLYEIENGKYKLNMETPNLKPVAEYLKQQGRFRHLTDGEIAKIELHVHADYAKLKARSDADQKTA